MDKIMQVFFVSVVMLITLAASLYWLYQQPDYKGKSFSHVVTSAVAGSYESIYIFFILLFTVATAGIAASIQDPDVNPIFRFIAHFGIGFLNFVSSIAAGKSMKSFWDNLAAGVNFRRWISSFGVLVITLTAAYILPISNLYVIAAGFKNIKELTLFLYDVVPWLNHYYVEKLVLYEEPLNYRALEHLRYPVVAELCVLLTQMLVEILLILYTWGNINSLSIKTTVDKPNNAPKQSSQTPPKPDKEVTADHELPLQGMLQFLGFDDTHVEKYTKLAGKALEKVDSGRAEHDIIMTTMADLSLAVISAENAPDDEKEVIRGDIFKFFATPVKDGGLGIQLKKIPGA